ncbi:MULTISPECIES: hypothetical protein [unclassified Streptomyces]|uniref:hypothetical protein n=1 Tax=unclassified Streptomyces TaxID=2593676 RepID=UPI0004C13E09|nr:MULTISPECIES: hypothetical protein [unclassified Streptomyces]
MRNELGDLQLGGSDDRGLDRLLWSTAGISAFLLPMAVVGLVKGNASWHVLPVFLGCPIGTLLAFQGRSQARLSKSIAGFALACLALVATGLLLKYMG